jgi:hypothetical protein
LTSFGLGWTELTTWIDKLRTRIEQAQGAHGQRRACVDASHVFPSPLEIS